eukprot:CAMPEP_0113478744 /NCGR_PEP_ID=MMETSP0014_2-20120614/20925_1 /TAXON_ID=2857 /ORGANISM="Nitzschia sp." /LENGTH=775 /DNA_ID=CAMNT_0000371967 /DNA_START=665 /DNA_END=2992 /DNA_ORIENTATION=- /assembly_acc=CAM_ASM_000159
MSSMLVKKRSIIGRGYVSAFSVDNISSQSSLSWSSWSSSWSSSSSSNYYSERRRHRRTRLYLLPQNHNHYHHHHHLLQHHQEQKQKQCLLRSLRISSKTTTTTTTRLFAAGGVDTGGSSIGSTNDNDNDNDENDNNDIDNKDGDENNNIQNDNDNGSATTIDIYKYFDRINDDDDDDDDDDGDGNLSLDDDRSDDDEDEEEVFIDDDEYEAVEVRQNQEQAAEAVVVDVMDVVEHHANIYTQWTVEDDQQLWDLYDKSSKTKKRQQEGIVVVEIASVLGRGIHGVSSRLAKLKDVNSSAYQRLFVGERRRGGGIKKSTTVGGGKSSSGTNNNSKKNAKKKKKKKKGSSRYDDDDDDGTDSDLVVGLGPPTKKKKKLVPITEVLRRIEYDPTLTQTDFSIRYYDRVEDKLLEANFDDPNTNISSSATTFIKALPEHRIMSVYFRKRQVWDRETKLDLVFGRNSQDDSDDTTTTTGIAYVIETYPQWEEEQQRLVQVKEERKHHIEYMMTRMLGIEYFSRFTKLMDGLYDVHNDPTASTKQHIEHDFVPQALSIVSEIRDDPTLMQQHSMDPSLIPQSDWLALDMISEYTSATIDDVDLRSQTLWEIFYRMDRIDGGKSKVSSLLTGDDELSATMTSNKGGDGGAVQPIILNEEELEENFVRGTGPGGQKINKTSNRVVLTHSPTQIRVECQDTRSLQQNRKIARKRLRLKLDEYFNGRQSTVRQQHIKASQKRQKSKSKNRARQRKKQLEKQLQLQQQEQEIVNDQKRNDDIDQYL